MEWNLWNVLSIKRLQKSSCQETREGKTYSPEVDVCGEEADLTFIPPPCPSPVRVPVNISSEHVPVYFDLETTGLGMFYNNKYIYVNEYKCVS